MFTLWMTAWGFGFDKRFLGHREQHRSSSSPLQVILVDGEDEEELWKLCTRSISFRMIYSALVGVTWRKVSAVVQVFMRAPLISSPRTGLGKKCWE